MVLNKSVLVGEILSINPSAAAEYLMSFDVASLRQYLDRLQLTRQPRGRDSVWIRKGRAPAVVASSDR